MPHASVGSLGGLGAERLSRPAGRPAAQQHRARKRARRKARSWSSASPPGSERPCRPLVRGIGRRSRLLWTSQTVKQCQHFLPVSHSPCAVQCDSPCAVQYNYPIGFRTCWTTVVRSQPQATGPSYAFMSHEFMRALGIGHWALAATRFRALRRSVAHSVDVWWPPQNDVTYVTYGRMVMVAHAHGHTTSLPHDTRPRAHNIRHATCPHCKHAIMTHAHGLWSFRCTS